MVLRLSSFFNDVLGTVLAGFSTGVSTAVTAADTVLSALGKLQAQVSLRATAASPTLTGTVNCAGPVYMGNNLSNSVLATGAASGSGPSVHPNGPDNNIDLNIYAKGSGLLRTSTPPPSNDNSSAIPTTGWIAAAYAPLVSPTLTGTVTLPSSSLVSSSTSALFALSGTGGNARKLLLQTAGSTRWDLTATSVAETGANAGSDLWINRYSDAGTIIDQPFSISRSAGSVLMTAANVSTNLTLYGSAVPLRWYDLSQGADGKYSDVVQSSGTISFRLVNDAYSAAAAYLTVARSGYAIGAVTLVGSPLGLSGNTTVTGTLKVSSYFAANGATPAAKPTITGSRSGATAAVLGQVITALANCGLVTDSTTA